VGLGKVILLDTHVLLWLAGEPEKLSKAASIAIREIRETGASLAISSVSLYEIARLAERGRIKLDESTDVFLHGLESLFFIQPITVAIALTAGQLPDLFPGDPMDRIIAATAISEGVPLITADQNIRRSRALKTIW
jgi:PIN domain nuclease of toxin-antitoxin system